MNCLENSEAEEGRRDRRKAFKGTLRQEFLVGSVQVHMTDNRDDVAMPNGLSDPGPDALVIDTICRFVSFINDTSVEKNIIYQ